MAWWGKQGVGKTMGEPGTLGVLLVVQGGLFSFLQLFRQPLLPIPFYEEERGVGKTS